MFVCETCKKTFARKENLKIHGNVCKGYEIITPKLAIVNDCANTTTTSVIMPSNYMYGYTFFAVDKLGKIVELDVRKYNSGARTKPALL